MEYAIVDIETTGGYADRNKICEIAIIIHDGEKVIEEYQSLINPERNIPINVQAIHGISDAMVQDAPTFYEEAETIYKLLENRVFVAHSVNFDYSFVKREFTSLGAKFSHKKLCTVRLSRKIFPGYKSYSLGNLCDHRNIKINDRHRAYGDAIATAELFTQLVQHDYEQHIEKSLKSNAKTVNIPENLARDVYEKLPNTPGVYYFLNQKHEIIYVGKAKDIKKRVTSHFGGDKGQINKQKFQQEIHHIDYQETGTELIALLHESNEIRKHWPRYNRAQKTNNPGYCIFLYEDQKGYKRLDIGRKQKGMKALTRFANHATAFQFMVDHSKALNICPKMTGIQQSPGACFDYQIKLCEGACAGEESAEEHNAKIEAFIDRCNEEKMDYVIMGKGRSEEEESFILVEDGLYRGYGYYNRDETIMDWSQWHNYLMPHPDHPEIYKILSSLAATKGYRKVLRKAFQHIEQ